MFAMPPNLEMPAILPWESGLLFGGYSYNPLRCSGLCYRDTNGVVHAYGPRDGFRNYIVYDVRAVGRDVWVATDTGLVTGSSRCAPESRYFPPACSARSSRRFAPSMRRPMASVWMVRSGNSAGGRIEKEPSRHDIIV